MWTAVGCEGERSGPCSSDGVNKSAIMFQPFVSGRLVLCGAPSDVRRLEPLGRGEIDAVFDEGIVVCLIRHSRPAYYRSSLSRPSSMPWVGWDGGKFLFRNHASRAWLGTSRRSISAAGQFTRTRRFHSRLRTTSAMHSPRAKRKFLGRKELRGALCTWGARATAPGRPASPGRGALVSRARSEVLSTGRKADQHDRVGAFIYAAPVGAAL